MNKDGNKVTLQQRQSGTYYLILPKAIVEAIAWKKGDKIFVFLEHEDLILKREVR